MHSHSMDMATEGTPWLTEPVMLHSSRKYTCSLNLTEQCDYQVGYWRFWCVAKKTPCHMKIPLMR